MTVFATIVTAVVATLTAGTPVSPNIYRARMRPIAQQHDTAVVVRIGSAAAERGDIGGAPVDFTTQLAVECYARSATTTPDLAADALLGTVYARLMADTTLGGLVMDMHLTNIDYDFDETGEKTACVTLQLAVRHRASSTTLT